MKSARMIPALFSVAILALGLCFGACKASVNGDANMSGEEATYTYSANSSSNVDLSGAEGEAIPPTGSTTAPAPPPAAPAVPGLPAECNGQIPQPQRFTEFTHICRCASNTSEVLWGSFQMNPNQPACHVPEAGQVVRRPLTPPPAATATGSASAASATAPPAATPPVVVQSSQSSRKVSCKHDVDHKILVCEITTSQGTGDAAQEQSQSYQCVGDHVGLRSDWEEYTGEGAPCRCTNDTVPRPIAGAPRTWRCAS